MPQRTYLEESNHDRRLRDIVSDIKSRLSISQDIIQLGIFSITCQLVIDRFEEELPAVWSAQLQAFSIGIGMYVAQFPEWLRFSDNAATAEFAIEDVTRLFQSGTSLVEELRNAGSAVDPEVPQTLAFLLEAIKDPRRALKRTVFAAIRTVENLVSAVLRSCGVVLGSVSKGIAQGVALSTKVITASSILVIAAHAAVPIDPAAGRVLQTTWLGKAGKLILESFNGSTSK